MKKSIIISVLVIAVIILLCLLVFRKHTYIKDTDMYKSINEINEIVVRYDGLTVEPIDPKEIDNKEDIKELFTILGNIELVKKTDIKVTDASMVIIIYENDKVTEFNFEADYFVMGDGNYQTKGFEKLEELLKKYN